MLIICQACHYRKQCEHISRRAKLVCSHCGAKAARRVLKTKIWMLETVLLRTPQQAREMTYGGLLWWARHKGYKDGWASVKYRLIFDGWPEFNEDAICVPSAELIRWMQKQADIYKRELKKQGKLLLRSSVLGRSAGGSAFRKTSSPT